MAVTLHHQAERCAELIAQSTRIAALSGAGLSTAAGIPDFRGPQGIYRRADVDPDRLFDINYFLKDPGYYYRFHRECVKVLEGAQPTFTHRFLAKLEELGKLQGIVTQNFDGLHEAAGSRQLWEIHGTIRHSHCLSCRRRFGYDAVNRQLELREVPRCDCGGLIKPDIVFFGESVLHLDRCESLCSSAELLLVLGSSLNVVPAALLPGLCRGAIVVVNRGAVAEGYLPARRIALRVDADLDQFFQAVASALGWR